MSKRETMIYKRQHCTCTHTDSVHTNQGKGRCLIYLCTCKKFKRSKQAEAAAISALLAGSQN